LVVGVISGRDLDHDSMVVWGLISGNALVRLAVEEISRG
jgi:hypothetical protein